MIRRAELKDMDKIKDLLHQVCNVHADGRPDIFKHGGIKYTDAELEALIPDDNNPIYVLVDENEELCGYGFCEIHDVEDGSSLHGERHIHIHDICVDECKRRRGVAKSNL